MWSDGVPIGIHSTGEQSVIRLGKKRTLAISPHRVAEGPTPIQHPSLFNILPETPAWGSPDGRLCVLDEEAIPSASIPSSSPSLSNPPRWPEGWDSLQSEIRQQTRFVREDVDPGRTPTKDGTSIAEAQYDDDLENVTGEGGVEESFFDAPCLTSTREAQEVTPKPREPAVGDDEETAEAVDEEEPKAILMAVLPEPAEEADFFTVPDEAAQLEKHALPFGTTDSSLRAAPFHVDGLGSTVIESGRSIKCPWYSDELQCATEEEEAVPEGSPDISRTSKGPFDGSEQLAVPTVQFFHRDLTEARASVEVLDGQLQPATRQHHIATCSELEVQHFEAEVRLWSEKLRGTSAATNREKAIRPSSPPLRKHQLTRWQALCEAALGTSPPPLAHSRTQPRDSPLKESPSACRVRNIESTVEEWKESEQRSKGQTVSLDPMQSPSTPKSVTEDPKATLTWFNNKLEQALLGGIAPVEGVGAATPSPTNSDGCVRQEVKPRRAAEKPLMSPFTGDLDQRGNPYRSGEVPQARYPFTAAPTNPFVSFGPKSSGTNTANRWTLNDPTAVQGKYFSDRASPPRLRGKPLLPPSFD